jgi:hypothetical protein
VVLKVVVDYYMSFRVVCVVYVVYAHDEVVEPPRPPLQDWFSSAVFSRRLATRGQVLNMIGVACVIKDRRGVCKRKHDMYLAY